MQLTHFFPSLLLNKTSYLLFCEVFGGIMRSHYRPPRDKQYFHTKPKRDKRMASLKKKIQLIQRKKSINRYEERFLKG
jgi:hypothetical protein